MRIIISPAKNMTSDADFLEPRGLPVFIERAEQLKEYLRSFSFEELKKLLCCNDSIAFVNYRRYQDMDLRENTNPAILSYDGIQYKYMAPHVFTYDYFDYTEKYVRILSGLYGILRPFDGVVPYRLEMQAKLHAPFCRDLYDFWGDSLYRELAAEDRVILNLASSEYAKTIGRFVTSEDTYITCVFGELENGTVREKGVYVKMARGEMVRYMAEQNITDPRAVRNFSRLGYSYDEKRSDETTYVFIRENCKKKQ